MDLLILTNWKEDCYNSILVIINRLTKIVYYKLVKIIINTPDLVKVIINIMMRHHGFSDLIVTNWESFFTSKFWSLLCYFFGIKQRLSIAFYSQINGQTEAKQHNKSLSLSFYQLQIRWLNTTFSYSRICL